MYKSQTDERDQIEISDLQKRIDSQKKGDDDDIVDTDIDRETSDEESEGKYQAEERKGDDLESDKSETDEIYQRYNQELFKRMDSQQKGDYDDQVDNNIDQETNNEESEEIDRIKESKENILEPDKSETDQTYQIEHPEILKWFDLKNRR